MRKLTILFLLLIAFAVLILAVFRNQQIKQISIKTDTYISTMKSFENIVIACKKSDYPSIDYFTKNSKYSDVIICEKFTKNLIDMYRSDKSFIFILSSDNLDFMRKEYPRMSLIEIEENVVFSPNKKFYISKNKCDCD
ncbi:MAG: hypothetical protein U9Q83_06665 [Bacteroidota bacterium]|nr:hypothetical protein [Bacteroidota bacterium]